MAEEKWVAVWANSPGVVRQTSASYAKDVTLRYPVYCALGGNTLRFVFSNKYGKETIVINQLSVGYSSGDGKVLESSLKKITFKGKAGVAILPGKSVRSDEIPFQVRPESTLYVSMYLKDYTSMRSGVTLTSENAFGYLTNGNYVMTGSFPSDARLTIPDIHFLTEADLWTDAENGCLVCFGDSLTTGAWPELLTDRCEATMDDVTVAIVRRAMQGNPILREYEEADKAHAGTAGINRFDREVNIPGARGVVILHGLGDLIYPSADNPLCPLSSIPESEQLIRGLNYYIKVARARGLEVYLGTIPPFKGSRYYAPYKDKVRTEVNEWIRECEDADDIIDFDELLRDEKDPKYLDEAFDCGDHIHLNEEGYRIMAEAIPYEAIEP